MTAMRRSVFQVLVTGIGVSFIAGVMHPVAGRTAPSSFAALGATASSAPSPEDKCMHYSVLSKTACQAFLLAAISLVAGCATESHQIILPPTVSEAGTTYVGPRYTLAVGNFNNSSSYENGIFNDGEDVLGSEAKTILETDLQQTSRFNIVDRNNMTDIKREAALRGEAPSLQGAQVVITGAITDFGRRTTGDQELFGILGAGKTQVAYAKVDLNVVDVRTSEVLFSVQGAGEYSLNDREVLGFGGASGYDSIINGKVLNLAIEQAVDKLSSGMQSGAWSPTAQGG